MADPAGKLQPFGLAERQFALEQAGVDAVGHVPGVDTGVFRADGHDLRQRRPGQRPVGPRLDECLVGRHRGGELGADLRRRALFVLALPGRQRVGQRLAGLGVQGGRGGEAESLCHAAATRARGGQHGLTGRHRDEVIVNLHRNVIRAVLLERAGNGPDLPHRLRDHLAGGIGLDEVDVRLDRRGERRRQRDLVLPAVAGEHLGQFASGALLAMTGQLQAGEPRCRRRGLGALDLDRAGDGIVVLQVVVMVQHAGPQCPHSGQERVALFEVALEVVASFQRLDEDRVDLGRHGQAGGQQAVVVGQGLLHPERRDVQLHLAGLGGVQRDGEEVVCLFDGRIVARRQPGLQVRRQRRAGLSGLAGGVGGDDLLERVDELLLLVAERGVLRAESVGGVLVERPAGDRVEYSRLGPGGGVTDGLSLGGGGEQLGVYRQRPPRAGGGLELQVSVADGRDDGDGPLDGRFVRGVADDGHGNGDGPVVRRDGRIGGKGLGARPRHALDLVRKVDLVGPGGGVGQGGGVDLVTALDQGRQRGGHGVACLAGPQVLGQCVEGQRGLRGQQGADRQSARRGRQVGLEQRRGPPSRGGVRLAGGVDLAQMRQRCRGKRRGLGVGGHVGVELARPAEGRCVDRTQLSPARRRRQQGRTAKQLVHQLLHRREGQTVLAVGRNPLCQTVRAAGGALGGGLENGQLVFGRHGLGALGVLDGNFL